MKILVVENNKEIASLIREKFNRYFMVETVYTGEEGEYYIHLNSYDLLIIDVNLKDTCGIDLCRLARVNNNDIPIIMLSGSCCINQKIMAFDAGADDFVTKPFSFEELFARIRALLRRKNRTYSTSLLKVDDLTYDIFQGMVHRKGKNIFLRKKALRILEYLMINSGRVVSREMILDYVWDCANGAFTNVVDVQVKYIRDTIDKPFDKKLIKTVRGIGYKMEG